MMMILPQEEEVGAVVVVELLRWMMVVVVVVMMMNANPDVFADVEDDELTFRSEESRSPEKVKSLESS